MQHLGSRYVIINWGEGPTLCPFILSPTFLPDQIILATDSLLAPLKPIKLKNTYIEVTDIVILRVDLRL